MTGPATADVSTGELWSREQVADVLRGAVHACESTRSGGYRASSTVKTLWPQIAPERSDYPDDEAPARRLVPSPQQVALADIALTWVMFVPKPADRRVLSARCLGCKWHRIARRDGRTSVYLRGQLWPAMLDQIARRLNDEKKFVPAHFTNLERFSTKLC